MTKLGRLVKANKIKTMEEIYLHSLPIKEYQIVDFFLPKLKDEVMKVRRTLYIDPRGGKGQKGNCGSLMSIAGSTDQARTKANARRSAH